MACDILPSRGLTSGKISAMPLSLVAAFWSVSVLFIITPGVDWAYSISAGLQQRRLLPAVAGLLSGHLSATVVVAAGVGALIAKAPLALTILTVAGSLYLLWLGLGLLRQPATLSSGHEFSAHSGMRWAVKGFCVSGLNPKVFLLFLALLPQFTDPAAPWPVSIQIFILGLLHVFTCGIVYLLVGYASRVILQTRPRAAKLVSRISGILMILIALLLLAEQFIGS